MSRTAKDKSNLSHISATITKAAKARIRMEVVRQNRLNPISWTEGAVIEKLAMDYLPPHPDETDATLHPPVIPAQLIKRKGIGKAKPKRKAVAA